MTNAGPTISFLGLLPNAAVEYHAARCRALIFPGEEDFGMAPLEVAAASGRPIAYRAGGAVETTIDGVTGVFFDRQEPEDLTEAIARFERIESNPAALRHHAEGFSTNIFQARFRIFLAKVGAPIREGALLPFNAPSWATANLGIGPRLEGIPA
jgi:glycosyltransferase involved in cell wall biosynthesis